MKWDRINKIWANSIWAASLNDKNYIVWTYIQLVFVKNLLVFLIIYNNGNAGIE